MTHINHGYYKCSKCGNDKFKISQNVYSKEVLPENHIEIICDKCSYGVVVVSKSEKCLKRVQEVK